MTMRPIQVPDNEEPLFDSNDLETLARKVAAEPDPPLTVGRVMMGARTGTFLDDLTAARRKGEAPREQAIRAEVRAGATETQVPPVMPAVEHPSHYRAATGHEAIDVIEAWGFGEGFNLGNAVKYICRAGLKATDPLEDIQKAKWYLERELERRKKSVPGKG